MMVKGLTSKLKYEIIVLPKSAKAQRLAEGKKNCRQQSLLIAVGEKLQSRDK